MTNDSRHFHTTPSEELTLNFTVVPGCCVAENPALPNREVVPPNGLEVVLVDPNRPLPLLVLVPKSGGHTRTKVQSEAVGSDSTPPAAPSQNHRTLNAF